MLRRWWLFSPRRLVVLAILVTIVLVFYNSEQTPQKQDPFNPVQSTIPLSQQGLPAPRFDAPLAKEHERMRREAYSKQRTPEEEEEYKTGFDRNAFNQFVSDRIPLDRQFPDKRNKECFDQRYYPNFVLPKTSVIIIFHNEAISTLLRTVWSVLNRSPPELIEEILLVDDASTGEWIRGPAFEEKIAAIPKVRLIKLPERSGLIRAKVAGAKEARGQVLTFLDSHCECNPGWLEPLLDRVHRDRTTVACPIIDVISDKTFEYITAASVHQRGVFSWYLIFGWMEQLDEMKAAAASPVEPYESPAMAGGLFSMDREYFFELGTYDLGMEVWGGENLEMSFRIWMCGGRIENVPCSRVGHAFRSHNPVSFKNNNPGATITRNLVRVADVWMDDYAKVYKGLNNVSPTAFKSDVSDRVGLRNALQCKSFDWYLNRAFPDLFAPKKENIIHMGILYNAAVDMCMDTTAKSYDEIQQMHLYPCDRLENTPLDKRRYSHNQLLFFTRHPANTIRKIELQADKCLSVVQNRRVPGIDGSVDALWFKPCRAGAIEWTYTDSGQLYHRQTSKCAEAQVVDDKTAVLARDCKRSNPRQKWVFFDTEVFS